MCCSVLLAVCTKRPLQGGCSGLCQTGQAIVTSLHVLGKLSASCKLSIALILAVCQRPYADS